VSLGLVYAVCVVVGLVIVLIGWVLDFEDLELVAATSFLWGLPVTRLYAQVA
jgi:hypothetical protein